MPYTFAKYALSVMTRHHPGWRIWFAPGPDFPYKLYWYAQPYSQDALLFADSAEEMAATLAQVDGQTVPVPPLQPAPGLTAARRFGCHRVGRMWPDLRMRPELKLALTSD